MNIKPLALCAAVAVTLGSALAVEFLPDGLAWPKSSGSSGGVINCAVFSTNTLLIVTSTGSTNTFNLPGNGGTFTIGVGPTNGYVTNLNPNTGQISYVETNLSATQDYFTYTNAVGNCATSGAVYIDITSTNDSCVPTFPPPGKSTNVVVLPALGRSVICLSWTNSSCHYTQQCQQTMGSGEVVFFTDLSSTCSNSICISNCVITTNCVLVGATVIGCDITDYNGVYYPYLFSGNTIQLTNVLNGVIIQSGNTVASSPPVFYDLTARGCCEDGEFETANPGTFDPCFNGPILRAQWTTTISDLPPAEVWLTNAVFVTTNCP